ncbi:Uncharacterised protein g8860 [Pycnogonum litorale]
MQQGYVVIIQLNANCSEWLVGVSIPATLPGESVAPAQMNLGPDEKSEKERIVASSKSYRGLKHNSITWSSCGGTCDDAPKSRGCCRRRLVKESFAALMKRRSC